MAPWNHLISYGVHQIFTIGGCHTTLYIIHGPVLPWLTLPINFYSISIVFLLLGVYLLALHKKCDCNDFLLPIYYEDYFDGIKHFVMPGSWLGYTYWRIYLLLFESTNTDPSNLKYNISMKCTVFTYHLAWISCHWF